MQFRTKPISGIQEVVRNAGSQAPSQPYGLRNSATGPAVSISSLCHSDAQQTLRTTDLNPSAQEVRDARKTVATAELNLNQDFSMACKHSSLLPNSKITIIINFFVSIRKIDTLLVAVIWKFQKIELRSKPQRWPVEMRCYSCTKGLELPKRNVRISHHFYSPGHKNYEMQLFLPASHYFNFLHQLWFFPSFYSVWIIYAPPAVHF